MSKDLLKLIFNPLVMAAAGGYGGKYANEKYKLKMNGVLAGVVGAGVGYLIGKGITDMLYPKAPVTTAPQQLEGDHPPMLAPHDVELNFQNQVPALPPGPGEAPRAPQEDDSQLGQHGFGFTSGGSYGDTGDGLGSYENEGDRALIADAEEEIGRKRRN